MSKAKESFDIEIGSRVNIKGKLYLYLFCRGKGIAHVLIIVVEAENLENNWGEKKWNKFVEKSKKESVKTFVVVEAFNSDYLKLPIT